MERWPPHRHLRVGVPQGGVPVRGVHTPRGRVRARGPGRDLPTIPRRRRQAFKAGASGMMTAMQPFNLPEIDRLLTTTKAVRHRLDLNRPVSRDVIVECIRLACYAPNASNGQEWRWVVLDDREQIRRAGELYRDILVPPGATTLETKLADGDEAGARISRSILYLA